jgi:hypothetical protein
VAKPLRELVVPVLFFAEGAFWFGIVATGGALLLVFAALACILSGLLLVSMPSHWVTRPLAGASALFGLTLTVYQVYQASTLFGSALSTLGLSSGAIFGAFAIVCVYLELMTLATGNQSETAKEP